MSTSPSPRHHKPPAVEQIEFYFSPENYVVDSYLRSLADSHGWTHLATVCGFNRMKRLGAVDPVDIAKSLRKHSNLLKVDSENRKVRPRWRLDPNKVLHPSQFQPWAQDVANASEKGKWSCINIWYPSTCVQARSATLMTTVPSLFGSAAGNMPSSTTYVYDSAQSNSNKSA